MLSAVVPFMAADHASRLLRAIHRIMGTALGLSLAAAILAVVRPSAPTAIFLVIVLQAGAELLIRRHYGWALVLMGGLVGATVLTLLFLPALYAAWFRVRAADVAAEPSPQTELSRMAA